MNKKNKRGEKKREYIARVFTRKKPGNLLELDFSTNFHPSRAVLDDTQERKAKVMKWTENYDVLKSEEKSAGGYELIFTYKTRNAGDLIADVDEKFISIVSLFFFVSCLSV